VETSVRKRTISSAFLASAGVATISRSSSIAKAGATAVTNAAAKALSTNALRPAGSDVDRSDLVVAAKALTIWQAKAAASVRRRIVRKDMVQGVVITTTQLIEKTMVRQME
jgi:hypothetical protein